MAFARSRSPQGPGLSGGGPFMGEGGPPFMGPPFMAREASLAINFLGPCAPARAGVNRFLHACCSTGQTRARRWSLHAQKCDPTCPSPATGPSSTHSEPVNTSRQIRKIHTVNHVPIAPLARVLSGSTLKSGLRALPLPHTRRAAPTAEHRCRRLALEEFDFH